MSTFFHIIATTIWAVHILSSNSQQKSEAERLALAKLFNCAEFVLSRYRGGGQQAHHDGQDAHHQSGYRGRGICGGLEERD